MIRSIRHHLRVLKVIVRMSFTRELMYRLNFAIGLVSGFSFFFASLVFFSIIYARVDAVAGWNRDQMILFLGTFYIIDSLWMGLWYFNIMEIPDLVSRGELDLYMTKPLSARLFVTTKEVYLHPLVNAFIGVLFVVGAARRLALTVTAGQVLLYAGLVLNGVLLFHSTFLGVTLVSIWSVRTRAVTDLVEQLYQFAQRPDSIYSSTVRFILTYVLPAAAFVSFPSRALLGRLSWASVSWGFLIGVILYMLCGQIWKKAVSEYSSSGS